MAKVYLLTGLSGSGKTTLSMGILEKIKKVMPLLVLDGDEIRSSLSSDLGFQQADRIENLRRCGEIARIASRQGITVLLTSLYFSKVLRRCSYIMLPARFASPPNGKTFGGSVKEKASCS